MTKQKRRGSEQTELRHIINGELQRNGFIWVGSSYTPATTRNLRETFKAALPSRLPGNTHIYVVRPEVVKYKGLGDSGHYIDEYCQRKGRL